MAKERDREGASASDKVLLQANIDLKSGNYGRAAEKCQHLLESSPNFAPARALLGTIMARAGRPTEAIEHMRKAVALDPRSADVHSALGMLLRHQGKTNDALPFLRDAVRLRPLDPGTNNNLGLAYLDLKRAAEAVPYFAKATSLNPSIAGAFFNLGVAYDMLGQDAEAISAYRRALALTPHVEAARLGLGRALSRQGNREEAIASFLSAAQSQSNSALGKIEAARILLEDGRASEAEMQLRGAIEREQLNADAHEMLGNALVQLGRFDEAITSLERAISIAPRHTKAYLGIVRARKIMTKDDVMIGRIGALLNDSVLGDSDVMRLHYALGKIADDLGQYGDAIHHFDEANRIGARHLRLSRHMIDRDAHTSNMDMLIKTFTTDFFAQSMGLGSDSELPVFIVGMIRSGTTLVEQIVSSHSSIQAGGEIPFWGRQRETLLKVAAGTFTRDDSIRIAAAYERVLREKSQAVARITDKMPTNFFLLGLIHLIQPRARIIHCRRDPVDTCLSVYTTPYPNFPNFAHDRGNIVYYYKEYLRLMAHWRQVLPADRFLEIEYEELVADPEPTVRRMIAFCGLEWDAACLAPERNSRSIQTPSSWQARQPVYGHSARRWHRYEPYLGEFRQLLPDD